MRGALLWGVLMAFLSMLPAVGAALVWAPVAIYFLVSGEVASGLGLVACGVLVFGRVAALLRPLLVGKDTSLPDCVILMTTLGGMAVFGLHGFVVGPAIAAMFITVWHIFPAVREQGVGRRAARRRHVRQRTDGPAAMAMIDPIARKGFTGDRP